MLTNKRILSLIKNFNVEANKSLGQNFLIDDTVCKTIINSAEKSIDFEKDVIIEVGPGLGSLTELILLKNPKNFYLIEKDETFIPILEELNSQRFNLINADALKIKIKNIVQNLSGNLNIHIISNLPYNISTKLLANWLYEISSGVNIKTMTLMFQKEVAIRITAEPKTKDYGRLSILSGWLCSINKICDVAPSSFLPPPKIDSMVISFSVKKRSQNDYNFSIDTLDKIVCSAFAHRRKKLKSNLKTLFSEEDLQKSSLDFNKRAEEISIDEFCSLASIFK